MNCLCNWFEDSTVWLIIIALLILYFGCNNGSCNGCISSANNTCGCNSGNYGCGIGCQ